MSDSSATFGTLAEAEEAGWVVFDHAGHKIAYMQQSYADADPERERPEANGGSEAELLADINEVEGQMAAGGG